MIVSNAHGSPNFLDREIAVDFAVLHYTACSLKRTLEIFASREKGVTAHFVVAEDGRVFDLGGFLTGRIFQGAHAGVSHVVLGDGAAGLGDVRALNTCSIGIEMVQRNGNLFDYPEAQLEAVTELLRWLTGRFPILRTKGRILGHEHIAGFRGKCDPGVRFNWPRLLRAVSAPDLPSHYQCVFTGEDERFCAQYLRNYMATRSDDPKNPPIAANNPKTSPIAANDPKTSPIAANDLETSPIAARPLDPGIPKTDSGRSINSFNWDTNEIPGPEASVWGDLSSELESRIGKRESLRQNPLPQRK